MNNLFRHIALITAAVFSLHNAAVAGEEPQDTLYFFQTWQQVLDFEPVAYYESPVHIQPDANYLRFDFDDKEVNHSINHDYVVASLGDSVWFVNTTYLDEHFGGDNLKVNCYTRLFFSEKVAYLLVDMIDINDYGYMGEFFYCYIDFPNNRLLKLNQKMLSTLLEDYHDLQMRYEGMRDYDEPYMMEEFFLKYVDRAASDPMRPNIDDF